MKIDREKLIQLLTEKTSMDTDAVESQLSELISRIREASEKGKALEIKGFGMFYFSEEGDLKFDPSEELETEVNFKYAGMKPVEIKFPRNVQGEEQEESAPDKAPASGIPLSEKRKKKEKELKPEESSASKVPAASASGKSRKKDSPASRSEKPEHKEEKNPAATLITSIVTVLVIVIGIILALDFGFLERNGTDNSQQQEQQAGVQSIEPNENESNNISEEEDPEPAGNEIESDEGESEEPLAEEEIEEVPEFGLYGTTHPIEGRYYSIVIHSFQNESDAREAGENISVEGYRAVVANVDVPNIGFRWRVGIGQFESISQAQQAAQELPRRYRENSFIGFIQ